MIIFEVKANICYHFDCFVYLKDPLLEFDYMYCELIYILNVCDIVKQRSDILHEH